MFIQFYFILNSIKTDQLRKRIEVYMRKNKSCVNHICEQQKASFMSHSRTFLPFFKGVKVHVLANISHHLFPDLCSYLMWDIPYPEIFTGLIRKACTLRDILLINYLVFWEKANISILTYFPHYILNVRSFCPHFSISSTNWNMHLLFISRKVWKNKKKKSLA